MRIIKINQFFFGKNYGIQLASTLFKNDTTISTQFFRNRKKF